MADPWTQPLQFHDQDCQWEFLPQPVQRDGHMQPKLLPSCQQSLRHHSRDHDGAPQYEELLKMVKVYFYLYMKTIERAHMPNKLWERVKLPINYENPLELIDKHLMYWPKFLVHKTKQRLTKMTQYRIRMMKLELKVREKIMTVPTKTKKREAQREEKAEKAAILDKSIGKELLERLRIGVYGDIYYYPVKEYNKVLDMEEKELLERSRTGVYGDIYSYPVKEYNKVLDMEGLQAASDKEEEDEEEPEIEYVEGYDELEEEEDTEDFGGFEMDESFKSDHHDGMDEDEEIIAVDWTNVKKLQLGSGSDLGKIGRDGPSTKLKRKARVLVEVEHEDASNKTRSITM